MLVELGPQLESRLQPLAKRQAVTVAQLVESVLRQYLDSTTPSDEPSQWVRATERQLGEVWPIEDFSGWSPPSANQAG